MLFKIQLLTIFINSESLFMKILQEQFQIISTLKQKIKEASKGETSKIIPPKAEEFLNKIEELKQGENINHLLHFHKLISILKETYDLYSSFDSEYQEKIHLILSRYAEIFNLNEDYKTSLDDIINKIGEYEDKKNPENIDSYKALVYLVNYSKQFATKDLCSKAIIDYIEKYYY